MKTMQETFNKIVEHAASMTSESRSEDTRDCMYRVYDETGQVCNMCFVGALIDKEHYSGELEGNTADADEVVAAVRASGYFADNDLFLLNCQEVHDQREITDWKKGLYEVAHMYDLKMPEVEWPLLVGGA